MGLVAKGREGSSRALVALFAATAACSDRRIEDDGGPCRGLGLLDSRLKTLSSG